MTYAISWDRSAATERIARGAPTGTSRSSSGGQLRSREPCEQDTSTSRLGACCRGGGAGCAPGICGPKDKPVDIPETAWKKLVERDHSFVRGTLPRWRGREQDTVLVS